MAELQSLLLQWLSERAEFGPLSYTCDEKMRRLLTDTSALRDARARGARTPDTHAPPPLRASGVAGASGSSAKQALAPASVIHTDAASRKQSVAVAEAATQQGASQHTEVQSLEDLRSKAQNCQRCAIGQRRQNLVFGTGSPSADLVLVGEAPGAQEDATGDVFVGPAGQLLTKMLAAIGFSREEVYICNILKCRPTNNRDPNPEEVSNCLPFLERQLALIQPKLLLALGRVSAKTLLGRELSLREMRGVTHEWRGVPLRVTYHPAALLRNQHWKRPAWEDLKALQALYLKLGGRAGSLG